MWRPKIRNHTFDWMGEKFSPLIDHDHFLGRSSIGLTKWNLPPVNITKHGNLFEMNVLVPGFKKNEIEIVMKDDVLTIKGEKKEKHPESSKFILEEFSATSFVRKFRLGEGIGHEKINAVYDNGVLKITFEDVPAEEEKNYQEVAVG